MKFKTVFCLEIDESCNNIWYKSNFWMTEVVLPNGLGELITRWFTMSKPTERQLRRFKKRSCKK